MNQPICYIEIGTADLSKAEQFYSSVFGWEFRGSHAPDYAAFAAGDGIGGGLYKIEQAKGSGGVIFYIAVNDINESMKMVRAAGGTVLVGKTAIRGIGWYGHFKDPDGNIVGLYTPAD